MEILDVGQSDCTLLRHGGYTLMIDAATAAERQAVLAALDERGIGQIDTLLITHPDEDHLGNARALLVKGVVRRLLLSPWQSDSPDERLVREAARQNGVPVETVTAGNTYTFGDLTLEILYADGEAEESNNGSVIFRAVLGETVCLFTGDAEAATEAALLAAIPVDKLRCDLLKVGHHGSDTSTSKALLEAAAPAHAAISCGRDNDYGFPADKLMTRLRESGAEIHRTDTEGTLCYQTSGNGLEFVTDKSNAPWSGRKEEGT